MSANDKQVGGDHYRRDDSGEQLWDRIYRLFGPGFLIGSAIKYLERYQHKDGVKDLKKALHYVEKLIELEESRLGVAEIRTVGGDGESTLCSVSSTCSVQGHDWLDMQSIAGPSKGRRCIRCHKVESGLVG